MRFQYNPIEAISIRGAKQGPLQDLDMDIPLGKLICFTGRCGSGSRTMAVDVLYAESRRRYMLALSPFERENLGGLGRVEAEHISGLPPAMFFDSRGVQRKESLAAFLQLEGLLGHLLHQYGSYHCPDCGGTCRSYSVEEAAEEAISTLDSEPMLVLAPLVWSAGTSGSAMVRELRRAGFQRIRQAGGVMRLDVLEDLEDRDNLEVVIDRLVPRPDQRNRIIEAVRNARAMAAGRSLLVGADTGRQCMVNQQLTCEQCGVSYRDITPDDFIQNHEGRKPLAIQVRLAGCGIEDLEDMTLDELGEFLAGVDRTGGLDEAISRSLEAARGLGLGHLKLARRADELSAGEQRRLQVAGCLSSGLTGILYLFESPMLGLHSHESRPLIEGMRLLVEQGNTVVALDHARPLLQAGDEVFAFDGGKVVDENQHGFEAGSVHIPQRRYEPAAQALTIHASGGRHLKQLEVRFPLHCRVCLTGAVGAGKTALLQKVIIPALRPETKRCKGIKERIEARGGERIRRVVELSGLALGKAKPLLAELGGFEFLAGLYAETPAAQKRGYPREWFLLDVPGGRCVTCEGRGVLHYDLEFLEDISLTCPTCEGRRYRPEILEIVRRGQNVNDVLEMSIDQAALHFAREPRIKTRLDAASACGLGGCSMGTPSDQLEPEAHLWLQLAVELARASSRDVLVLDNPAAGSHPQDVQLLIGVLDQLVAKGVSVLVADHHPGLINTADWLIELGPGGGPQGGQVVSSGPHGFSQRAEGAASGRSGRG